VDTRDAFYPGGGLNADGAKCRPGPHAQAKYQEGQMMTAAVQLLILGQNALVQVG